MLVVSIIALLLSLAGQRVSAQVGGLQSSTSLVANAPLTASAVVTAPVICAGGQATVEVSAAGGRPPYAGIGTFTAAAGTHAFIVSDATGSRAVATLHIEEPHVLRVSATTIAVESACGASDAAVRVIGMGGTEPYAGTGLHMGLTAGEAAFYVTDQNGCRASTRAIIAKTDTDLDSVPDCEDYCPNGLDPGHPCDDGNDMTENDVIAMDCTCHGSAMSSSTTEAARPQGIIVGSSLNKLRVWPNPSHDGTFNVLLVDLGPDEPAVNLTMIDMRGRVLSQVSIPAVDRQLNALLTGDRPLPPGTYLLTLRTDLRSWTERVVVE